LNEEGADLEIEASKFGLNPYKLDGNARAWSHLGAFCAMVPRDGQHQADRLQTPANFPDIGGLGAFRAQQVENRFRILLSDPEL
jgi:succinyl-CoA synthetase beta subunit